MPINRRLITDQDFSEVLERHLRVRVFQDDQLIGSGGTIIRFDDQTIVVQSSVSDVAYHPRKQCEFFEIKK
jgi:RNase P/RNase MRP subunit p29